MADPTGWLRDEDRVAIANVFERHRIDLDQVFVVSPIAADEIVFVLRAATFPETELTSELMSVLNRKVWVSSDGPAWSDRQLQAF